MNLRMTVCASRIEGNLGCRRHGCAVYGMALEAEKGLSHLQELVIYGTMRIVAIGAVLRVVSMFEDGGRGLISMALSTGVPYFQLSELAAGC